MDRAEMGTTKTGPSKSCKNRTVVVFVFGEHSKEQTVDHGLPFTMSCLFAMNTRKQVYDFDPGRST